MSCSEIQEQLARGQALTPEQRGHAASCPRCVKVATTFSLLDETLAAIVTEVPADFADRVMAQVRAEVPARGWMSQQWILFAVVSGSLAVGLFNLLRFLVGVLVPSVGLGGMP